MSPTKRDGFEKRQRVRGREAPSHKYFQQHFSRLMALEKKKKSEMVLKKKRKFKEKNEKGDYNEKKKENAKKERGRKRRRRGGTVMSLRKLKGKKFNHNFSSTNYRHHHYYFSYIIFVDRNRYLAKIKFFPIKRFLGFNVLTWYLLKVTCHKQLEHFGECILLEKKEQWNIGSPSAI